MAASGNWCERMLSAPSTSSHRRKKPCSGWGEGGDWRAGVPGLREEGSGGIHKAAARLMPCSNQPCSTRGVRLAGEKVEYGLFSHMVNSRRMRYWGFVSVLLLAQLHCSAHPPTPVHLPASLRAQVQARYTKGRPHAHVPRRSTCFYTVLPLATPATLPPCHLASPPPFTAVISSS